MGCREVTELAEFQAALLAPDRLALRVVPGAGWNATTAERVAAALAETLGPSMRIEVTPVAALARAGSEKRQLLVGGNESGLGER